MMGICAKMPHQTLDFTERLTSSVDLPCNKTAALRDLQIIASTVAAVNHECVFL